MTDLEHEDAAEEPAEPADDDFERALRGALAPTGPAKDVGPDILGAVQKRLREESGGRFYADAWALEREPPVRTYLVTGLAILLVSSVLFALWTLPAGPPTRVEVPRSSASAPAEAPSQGQPAAGAERPSGERE